MNASQKRSFLGDCVTIQMSFSKLNAIPMIDLGIEHLKNIFMKKMGTSQRTAKIIIKILRGNHPLVAVFSTR